MISIPEWLPAGVSQRTFDAIRDLAKPINAQQKELAIPFANLFGVEIVLNKVYPLRLGDGTIVNGVVSNGRGEYIYLIDSSQGEKENEHP